MTDRFSPYPEIRCRLPILASALLLIGTGCGGKDKPVPVAGLVTLDGQPLAQATVRFTPREGEGPIAAGLTDHHGLFKLTTFSTGDGALPGDYKVTVTLAEIPKELNQVDLSRGNPKLLIAKRQLHGSRPKVSRSPVPELYRNAARTPFQVRVPTSEKVVLELDSKLR